MDTAERRKRKEQLVAGMLAGRRWHAAAHAAGMKKSDGGLPAASDEALQRPGLNRDLEDLHAGERVSIMAAGWRWTPLRRGRISPKPQCLPVTSVSHS